MQAFLNGLIIVLVQMQVCLPKYSALCGSKYW